MRSIAESLKPAKIGTDLSHLVRGSDVMRGSYHGTRSCVSDMIATGDGVDTDEMIDTLGGFSLFADLSRPELEAVVHTFDEEWFAEGQRIVRRGFSGSGFYVILDGAAVVNLDGREWSRLGRGDFFGEISILLNEPPTADVVAESPLRCLVLPRADLRDWLVAMPTVTMRMLQAELRRLRSVTRWRS
jgi:CRP-like cAMP-binding protein